MTKVIEMSDELFEKLKDEITIDGGKEVNNYEDMVGSKFYFRTVTYHSVGEVKKIVGRFAYLKNASWVADSGRFMNAIKDGTLNEVEPVGDCFVNLDSVVDFFPWKHVLPTQQKWGLREALIELVRKFFRWRQLVFERDNFTCQICGQRGGELHPDHIKQFAYYPKLRFEISNGRTLCKKCHMKTESWGFKKMKKTNITLKGRTKHSLPKDQK